MSDLFREVVVTLWRGKLHIQTINSETNEYITLKTDDIDPNGAMQQYTVGIPTETYESERQLPPRQE